MRYCNLGLLRCCKALEWIFDCDRLALKGTRGRVLRIFLSTCHVLVNYPVFSFYCVSYFHLRTCRYDDERIYLYILICSHRTSIPFLCEFGQIWTTIKLWFGSFNLQFPFVFLNKINSDSSPLPLIYLMPIIIIPCFWHPYIWIKTLLFCIHSWSEIFYWCIHVVLIS